MIFIQFIVSMIATISFSILFTAPKKEILFCGFTGAIAWTVYYGMTEYNLNTIFSYLVATFCLTVFSRIFAVIRQKPITVYLLTGIFPLVPGAGIYYTAYYLFTGNNEMFGIKGLQTIEIAGAIVFGIIFGFGIPQNVFHKLAQKKAEINEEH